MRGVEREGKTSRIWQKEAKQRGRTMPAKTSSRGEKFTLREAGAAGGRELRAPSLAGGAAAKALPGASAWASSQVCMSRTHCRSSSSDMSPSRCEGWGEVQMQTLVKEADPQIDCFVVGIVRYVPVSFFRRGRERRGDADSNGNTSGFAF